MKSVFNLCVVLSVATSLVGCAVSKQAKDMQADAATAIRTAREKEPPSVISKTSGAWLMGNMIKVSAPISPILKTQVTYHPIQKVTLSEISSFISLETGLLIDVSEVQVSSAQQTGSSALQATPGGVTPPNMVMPSMGNMGLNVNMLALQPMSIVYQGSVSGLLDVAANKAGIWWKFADGKVIFYRTETKTFYLPANTKKSTGSGTIASTSSGGGGGGGGAGGPSGAASSSSNGMSITSDYTVDLWADLEKTAKAVGVSAQTVVNPSAGSLTVTGTPAQVKAVEQWVSGLIEQLSLQVAITVKMYTVKMKNEDTYNWNPNIVFKDAAGNYNANLTPATALIPQSGGTPAGIAVNVLAGTGASPSLYTGSQAAFLALSTLGNISESLQQTVITLNGQPAPIQVANQQGYLASSTTVQTANVGSTTTQTPGTITTGFTATFVPRVVNGKIILAMTMANSFLNSITTVGNSTAFIQTPNVDLSTFEQSVSLTPGDALLLTGLQQDRSKSNNSGIGSPTNAWFGGGSNSNTEKSMVAIVVSARVL